MSTRPQQGNNYFKTMLLLWNATTRQWMIQVKYVISSWRILIMFQFITKQTENCWHYHNLSHILSQCLITNYTWGPLPRHLNIDQYWLMDESDYTIIQLVLVKRYIKIKLKKKKHCLSKKVFEIFTHLLSYHTCPFCWFYKAFLFNQLNIFLLVH